MGKNSLKIPPKFQATRTEIEKVVSTGKVTGIPRKNLAGPKKAGTGLPKKIPLEFSSCHPLKPPVQPLYIVIFIIFIRFLILRQFVVRIFIYKSFIIY